MLLREDLEKREIENLSPLAVKSAFSRGRAAEEEKCDIRTEFQRDRDRIIHSKSFRRLMHKVGTEPEVLRRGGHDLHQPLRAGPRHGVGVEARLLVALSGYELPIPPRHTRSGLEMLIVGGYDSLGARQVARPYLAADLTALFLLRTFLGSQFFTEPRRVPTSQGFGQQGSIMTNGPRSAVGRIDWPTRN